MVAPNAFAKTERRKKRPQLCKADIAVSATGNDFTEELVVFRHLSTGPLRSVLTVFGAQGSEEVFVSLRLLMFRAPVRVDSVPSVSAEDMPAGRADTETALRSSGATAGTTFYEGRHWNRGIVIQRRLYIDNCDRDFTSPSPSLTGTFRRSDSIRFRPRAFAR